MSSLPRVLGVVLAGGESRRLGVNKLSLRLGSQTVLEHVLSGLSDAGLDKIYVALGPRSHALADSLPTHAQAMLIDHQTSDMRQTLEEAIAVLQRHEILCDHDAVLVALADQPTISPQVVQCLIREYRLHPGRITLPSFEGKRGHPVILPWPVVEEVKILPTGLGLNALIHSATDVHQVEISDRTILDDLDTPADRERYESLPWE